MKITWIKSFGVLCVLSLLSLLSSCSSVYDKHIQWEREKPESFPVINAIGYAPISLQNSEHETQRMLMAMKASKISAYAELAEQVYGQQVNGNTSMSNLLVGNEQLKASITGIIRGAKVVKSYAVGDMYATEIILDFKDVYDLYLANNPSKKIKSVDYF